MKSVIGTSLLLLPSLVALTSCVPLDGPFGTSAPGSGRGYDTQPGYGSSRGYASQSGATDFGTSQGIGGRPPGAAPYQPHSDSGGQAGGNTNQLADPGSLNLQSPASGATAGSPTPGSEAPGAGGAAGSSQAGGTPDAPSGSSEPPASASGSDHPRGIPVPNMPGHVYSPHSRDQGIVDVSEWPSGTLVKDPFKPTEDLWFYVP